MAQRPKGPTRANPTLEQVARLAGVSIATASRVVTGAVPVSADRRGRVERAIAELDYVPDERARDLRRATTRTVGIVVPSLPARCTARCSGSSTARCSAAARRC